MPPRITLFDDPTILAEVTRLYRDEGASTAELGVKYGCSIYVIIRVLRNNGVTIRARGGTYIAGAKRPASTPRKGPVLTEPTPFNDMPWVTDALCRSEGDPDTFYPEGSGGGWRAREAKKVCRRCPVINQCLTWAIETREPWGVWGGLSERERRALIRKQQAARTAA